MNTKFLIVSIFIASCVVLFNAGCLDVIQREQINLIKNIKKKDKNTKHLLKVPVCHLEALPFQNRWILKSFKQGGGLLISEPGAQIIT